MLIDIGLKGSSITKEKPDYRNINVNDKYAKIEKNEETGEIIDGGEGWFAEEVTKYLRELYRWGGTTK